ncbi:MAG: hypothetical protein ACLR95_19155 [Enterococcus avium]
MKPNILHAIFFDEYQNWEKFNQRYTRRIRSVVKREVKKFRDCGDLKKVIVYLSVKDAMM